MEKINVRDWEILPCDSRMNTYHVRALLDSCRNKKGTKIYFPKGVYHFYPDYAVEKLLYISNHDEDTIKRIAFDFTGFEEVCLTGEDVEFIFHTDILPFYVHDCRGFTLKGIRIDYARPAYSEGMIQKVEPDRMELFIDKEQYPYEIIHDRIYFKGENFCLELTNGCLEMDRERKAPVYEGQDISFNRPYEWSYGATFRELSKNLVEIRLTDEKQSFPCTSKAGNHLILRHHRRTHPAIYVTDSSNILCEDVTIYHCTGMALISQFTTDITLRRVDIRRHPKKQRIFTATADGFHFVYCGGSIHIADCFLENQLDDPVNIHGIYGRVHRILAPDKILVELVEGMQKGVPLGRKGDRFHIINHATMLAETEGTIKEIRMLNGDFQYMEFDQPLNRMEEGYVVENMEYVPDVLIEGCTFQNNRARGLLLTSGGEVLVRNNTFRIAGAAILIEGDSSYWFESGSTRHICVEQNKFIDCAYVSGWGAAPIQVSPSAAACAEGKRYHKCLEIKNNEFWCFDQRIVYAQNLESLIFQDNIIHQTNSFPPLAGERIRQKNVISVIEKNNRKEED